MKPHEPKPLFIRYVHAEKLLEFFFVTAIGSILLIRTFLFLTGYPQLGGGGFHIAHLLWGGLFMLAALVISLSSLGYRSMRLVAIVGGIGFGAFIDEIGKFVTRDNNYFFRPSIVLIYVIFLSLYLLFRTIGQARSMTQEEYAVNALALSGEVVHNDLDKFEKQQLSEMLDKLDPKSPVSKSLHELIRQIELADPPPPSILVRLKQAIRKRYDHLRRQPWFPVAVAGVMGAQAAIGLTATGLAWYQQWSQGNLSIARALEAGSVLTSSIIVVVGIVSLRRGRAIAYDLFRQALLFDIFLTQFFVFYREQFGAVLGLGLKLVLLIGIEYVVSQEHKRHGKRDKSTPAKNASK